MFIPETPVGSPGMTNGYPLLVAGPFTPSVNRFNETQIPVFTLVYDVDLSGA